MARLAGVAAVGLLLTTATPFPGWVALLPTAATALVIATGPAAGGRGPAALLSLRPLVWLGGISYAVYLWHWPLIVIARDELDGLTFPQGLLVVVLAVIPAWASTRFLENPIRRSPQFAALPRTVAVGVVCSTVAFFAGLMTVAVTPTSSPLPSAQQEAAWAAYQAEQDPGSQVDDAPVGAEVLAVDPAAGVPVDVAQGLTMTASQAKDDNPSVYADGCHRQVNEDDAKACVYGDEASDYTVAIVGDSHAAQWVPALQIAAATNGWRLESYTKSSCPLTTATVTAPESSTQPYASCNT